MNEKFKNTATATPSASVTSIATLLVSGITDNRKKCKLDSTTPQTISEDKIAKCNVSKKRKIQLALTEHHINYLKGWEFLRSIPKSFRINSTIQVPSINSTLQFKWEEAVLSLGTMPTLILLENWVNQQKYTILRYLDDIMIWSKQWSCRSRGESLPFNDLKLISQDNDQLLNPSVSHPDTIYDTKSYVQSIIPSSRTVTKLSAIQAERKNKDQTPHRLMQLLPQIETRYNTNFNF